jgi:hypothetical protein
MMMLNAIKTFKFTVLFALLAMFTTISAHSAPTKAVLNVTPEQCVALRKGQTCYLEVTFDWQYAKAGNYCLVNTTRNKVLKCWSKSTKGQYSFDFQSTKSNDFVLRQQDSAKVLAHTQVVVAWVYKSNTRSKSRWRLF